METVKMSKTLGAVMALVLGFSSPIFAQAPSQHFCIELAEAFYKNMTEGNYVEMRAVFDENLKQEIPLEALKKHVQNLYKTHGKILKRGRTLLGVMEDEHIVSIIPLYFENKNMELRLAINSKKRVDDLFFTVFDAK